MSYQHLKPYSYIIYKSGSDYYGRDENGLLAFGGPNDAGGADGASFGVVVNACIGGLPSEGGLIHIKAGSYALDTSISINDFAVVLEGDGIGTKITLANGSNLNMIEMTGSGKNFQVVRNLYLHGNRDNNTIGHGIYMNHAYAGGSDAHAKVEHCWIRETAQDGIRIAPNSDSAPHDTREAELINVTVTKAGRDAFAIGSSDHKIYGCIAEQPYECGFNLMESQHQLTLCKAFGAGDQNGGGNYPGFGVYSIRTQLTNCQAQDNYGVGFEFTRENCVATGCQADSNCQSVTGAGFWLNVNASFNELVGCVAFDRFVGGERRQEYGLRIGSGCTTNVCDVVSRNNITKQIYIQNVNNIVRGFEDNWNYQSIATAISTYTPTGDPYNGREVKVYSSHTSDGGNAIFTYINGAWKHVEVS